ncbi:MAG: hypothetical protein ACRDYW_13010 [Acidimicrobiales bacterium]
MGDIDITVSIDIDTDEPVTVAHLLAMRDGEYGTASCGRIGGHRLTCVLRIGADDLLDAARLAAERVLRHVPGVPVAVEVMTSFEAARRQAQWEADLRSTADQGDVG